MSAPTGSPKDLPVKRRRLRFSLRTALLLMAGISAALGLVASRIHRGQRQARIVAQLQQFETRSDYDPYPWTQNGETPANLENSLAIAVHSCGLENYFYNVVAIHCHRDLSLDDSRRVLALIKQLPAVRVLRVSGLELHSADLATLPQLESLELLSSYHYDNYHSGVLADDDLIPLRRATQLKWLELGNQPIGNQSLSHLDECVQLRHLEVGRTDVGDDGLRNLRSLTAIRNLDLYRTKVTDAGLKNLAALNLLESLNIGGTRINGSGFEEMGPKPELQTLYAFESEIDDEGLAKLSVFPSLRTLDLSKTKVHGMGLAHVCRLENLTNIHLDDCPITDEGVRELPPFPEACVYIGLARTRLTDTGFTSLRLSPQLYQLDLEGTSVTDATMEYLTKYKELRRVNVTGTQVTQKGTWRLKGVNLDCNIETDVPW